MTKRPVRVIVLGPLPPPYGGPEVMTVALVDGLKSCPNLVVSHLNTQVSRSLAEKGGRNQARKSLSGLVQAARLGWGLLTFHPDAVYLPLTNSPSFLGFLRDALFFVIAFLAGKRVAVRLHGGYYFYAHVTGLRRLLVARLLGRVCLAMVQGQRLRNAFDGLIPADRIVVIPNGLDDAPFAEARRRTAGRGAGARPRVLFVGLMCLEKGFRDVIASVPHVPGADFIFAGEWPSIRDKAEVDAFLAQHGVTERVTFAGVVAGPAKYDLFVSSDIFVFPTYFVYEGHAVSSVEALAAGLPIICTNHGALDELLRDGVNGFFVPRSDSAALADRLNELIENETLRQTLGRNSRRLYEERFTIQQFLQSWSTAVLACSRNSSRAGSAAADLPS